MISSSSNIGSPSSWVDRFSTLVSAFEEFVMATWKSASPSFTMGRLVRPTMIPVSSLSTDTSNSPNGSDTTPVDRPGSRILPFP